MSEKTNYISKTDALLKLQAYCAYQERCHQEVRTKLIKLKIFGDDLEDIIISLINDNFLNEERFAKTYARGKFRIKNWGRSKIVSELKRRKISDYCIKKGLEEIEEEEYTESAKKVILKHFNNQKGILPIRKQKTFAFAYRKGYEATVINSILRDCK